MVQPTERHSFQLFQHPRGERYLLLMRYAVDLQRIFQDRTVVGRRRTQRHLKPSHHPADHRGITVTGASSKGPAPDRAKQWIWS